VSNSTDSTQEQEPDLFPGTIKFNIGLGVRPGAEINDEDIQRVAKECELHDFIMSLPEGYNTEVATQRSFSSTKQLPNWTQIPKEKFEEQLQLLRKVALPS
jgi:ABC-type multidrug transport system fused ATPase/permease subunit